MGDNGSMCPVFRPTREEFEQPFSDYVRKVFRKNPDLAMFKVVPPRGWKPRRTPFPDLRKVQINVPIRQHVFGTKGAYRCVFVEQKPMTVAEFKLAAEEEAARLGRGANGNVEGAAAGGVRASTRTTSARHNRPPPDHESNPGMQQRAGGEGEGADAAGGQQQPAFDPDAVDPDMERSFWANVTLNPPMYGADTPTSFFDDKLPYGWNLQHLGDLLQSHPKVDSIPGVTTPMTYFGMWRSFFGWHKEDADLYSINFLHWGAPKVWYGVAPSARQKFERMAQSLFPELHRVCPAFVRHKDIMLSPSCLKTYGVPVMRACQRPNEFVVLNAAAYHAGFNSGFNCAEAVNFGIKEWIPVGKEAVPCRCSALKDGVRISMKLFDPKWVDPYETPSESTEEEPADSEQDEEEEEEGGAAKRRRGRGKAAAPTKRGAAQRKRGRRAEESSEEEEEEEEEQGEEEEEDEQEEEDEEEDEQEEEDEEEDEQEEEKEAAKPRRKRVATKKALAAAAEAAAKARKRGQATAQKKKAATAAKTTKAKKPTTAEAAAAVKKHSAKKGPAAAAKGRAAAAAVEAPAAATTKRGPGRPRKEVATATVAASPADGKRPSGRKRKAPEDEAAAAEVAAGEEEKQQAAAAVADSAAEDEKGKEEGIVGAEVGRAAGEEADGPRDGPTEGEEAGTGRGGRPRRAAATAAAALMAAATRKRPRTAAASATAADAAQRNPVDAAADGKADLDGGGAAAAALAAVGRGRSRAAARAAGSAVAVVTGGAAAPAPVPPAEPPALTLPAAETNADGKLVVTAVKPRSTVAAAAMALKARTNTPSQEPVIGPPMAIVGDADTAAGRRVNGAGGGADKRFFFLVQRLARPAPTPGNVLLRWLKEGRDGLFRPVAGSVWEEPARALLPVRALAVCGEVAVAAATATPPVGGNASDDGEHGGTVSSSSSAAGGAGGGGDDGDGCGQVAGGGLEPEAWRLVTPREQIVDVELRRE